MVDIGSEKYKVNIYAAKFQDLKFYGSSPVRCCFRWHKHEQQFKFHRQLTVDQCKISEF